MPLTTGDLDFRVSDPWREEALAPTSATACAPVTVGELVQGVIDGRDFLITSPVDLYSTATVELRRDLLGVLSGGPQDFSKSVKAVQATLRELGLRRIGARVRIASSVPRGKGMASSTSDMTAAIHACAEAAGKALAPHVMSRIAVSIEPSDGIFFPGVVIYDHLKGEVLELLGAPPPLSFVVVDTGGEVDTVGFDRERARANARAHAHELERAVDLVRKGFRRVDPALVAAGATLSARCHQPVLFKPELEELIQATAEVGALGVNCAHSGTVVGVMFDPTRTPAERVWRRVAEVVGARQILGVHRLVSGGSRIVRANPACITDEQRPFVNSFGEPVNRIETGEGSMLEFHAGEHGHRFFVRPDGTLLQEHPLLNEGLWESEGLKAPRPGEHWEARAVVLRRDGEHVRYRLLASPGCPATVARVLSRSEFEESFTPAGEEWIRRVKVAAADHGTVAVVGRDVERAAVRLLPLPVFLGCFRRSAAAPSPRPALTLRGPAANETPRLRHAAL